LRSAEDRALLEHPAPDALENESARIRAELAREGATSRDYIFLVITSCLLATCGLLANSPAVVIGAMIVAPLMLPIRAAAFGILRGNARQIGVSATAICVGVGLAIGLSGLVGLLVGMPTLGSELQARTQPTLLDLVVAIVAGSVSGYAKIKQTISDSLAGTAIAVALMPPLCTVGLSFAAGYPYASMGAFLLFVTNLLGIALACMSVFAFFGHGKHVTRTRRALGITAIMTLALVLPLGYGLWTMVQQARLAAVVTRLLTTRTVTVGQHMELVSTQVNWSAAPPEARLLVRAPMTPSPVQVQLLEAFVQRETGHSFRLEFEVSRIETVNADTTPAPTPSPSP
jgi:uncharacterized hydrophobic protein (TIGR00271 family)